MATHSSSLAWKIPWMKEPGRLQSMGSWRVGHDWATSLHLPFSWIDLLLTSCLFLLSFFFCLYFPSLLKVDDKHFTCVSGAYCVCHSVESYSVTPWGTYSPSGSPGFSVCGIFQAEYWSGLPLPSSGDLPDPGTEPGSPAWQADSLPSEPPRKAA